MGVAAGRVGRAALGREKNGGVGGGVEWVERETVVVVMEQEERSQKGRQAAGRGEVLAKERTCARASGVRGLWAFWLFCICRIVCVYLLCVYIPS